MQVESSIISESKIKQPLQKKGQSWKATERQKKHQ